MPSTGFDHNYYTQHHRRPSSPPSRLPALDVANPFSSTDALLQPLVYSSARDHPGSTPRSTAVSNSFDSAGLYGPPGSNDADYTADPHEYYRPFQDVSHAATTSEQLETMTTTATTSRRPLPRQRGHAAKHQQASGPGESRTSTRSSAIQPNGLSSLNSTKSTPTLSTSSRSRQSSLKDLVDRFNQSSVDSLPLPSNSSDRPKGRKASLEGAAARFSRASPVSEGQNALRAGSSAVGRNRGQEGSVQDRSSKVENGRARKKALKDDQGPTPSLTSRQAKPERSSTAVANNPWASHSMTSRHLAHNESAHRPLFGEVLNTSNGIDIGFGIRERQRRGSDSTLHRPAPPSLRVSSNHSDDSPPSPTSFYLRDLPQRGVNGLAKKPPPTTRQPHRRTRSDFTGVRNTTTDNLDLDSAISESSRLNEWLPQNGVARATKHAGPSRIPLSTNRRSTPSESGSSPRSGSRPPSASSSNFRGATTKGQSGIPQPNRRSISPVKLSPSTPPRSGPKRLDVQHVNQDCTSPRLKAYISAPLPKKSPPLRSSRPRLPVSSASSSTTKTRISERYDPQKQDRRTSDDRQRSADGKPRPKKLPELGSVDFAERRDRIQRQFTKRVREREKREEYEAERRRAMKEKEENERTSEDVSQCDATDESAAPRGDDETLADDKMHLASGVQDQLPPSIPRPQRGEDEKTNDLRPSEECGVDIELPYTISQEDIAETVSQGQDSDSPTLGVPGAFPGLSTAVQDERALTPTSAVTADTATTIENEPQVQTLAFDCTTAVKDEGTFLGQVIHVREPSPSRNSEDCLTADSGSEKDDKESIQIVLGTSPLLSQPTENDGSTTWETRDVTSPGHLLPQSRWSVESDISSIRPPNGRLRQGGLADGQPASVNGLDSPAVDRSQREWPPAIFQASKDKHTTLDSEAYSTINKVLAHYHEPELDSPESLYSFQQHLLTKSPELARQGGWDPKRVTQLYLEELRRRRANEARSPEGLRADHATATSSKSTASGEAFGAQREMYSHDTDFEDVDPSPDDDQRYMLSEVGWSSSKKMLTVDEESYPAHRASLQGPEDWRDASPSVMDWGSAQAADSPVEEKNPDFRPTPPPKDSKSFAPITPPLSEPSRDVNSTPNRDGAETPRQSAGGRPRLPHIESAGDGLGLAIQIEPPPDSPMARAPPLPTHAPPPPPIPSNIREQRTEIGQFHADPRSPPSPSVYSRNPLSSEFPAEPPNEFLFGPDLARTNGASPQQHRAFTTSPPQTQPSSKSQSREQVVEEPQREHSLDLSARSSSPSSEDRRLLKRQRLIREILDTERSYYTDMQVTDEIYKGSSGACPKITADDVKVVFGNTNQVVRFSAGFYAVLRNAGASIYRAQKLPSTPQSRRTSATTSNSTDDKHSSSQLDLTEDEKDRKTFIGEAFGEHISRMEKVYGDYLRNHEAASKRLVMLQGHPSVEIWLNECKAVAEDITSAWSLDSLLVKPVQRFLKYPLLLKELLEVTPESHPDYTALDVAAREVTAASHRINEMKRRVDIVEMVVGRKRKESDVRVGLSKAIRGRTEKFRQQVGLTEMVDDPDYNVIAERWDPNYIQLQFAMRDYEGYLVELQSSMDQFSSFIGGIETFVDVSRTHFPELESKWRRFAMAMRELSTVALADHKSAVQRSVINPMKTLIQLYDAPQKIIQKRNKRILDYARCKAVKDRGDKPDKRTQEHGEQFTALNDTLKDELPKLYALTAKLAEACLEVFIEISIQWQSTWQVKLKTIFDEHEIPKDVSGIIAQFLGDFPHTEAQVLTLGICNGSVLAETVNFLSPQSTHNDDSSTSSKYPRKLSSRSRTLSLQSDASPVIPAPDFGQRHSGSFSFSPLMDSMSASATSQQHMHPPTFDRAKTASSISTRAPATPDVPSTTHSFTTINYGTPSQTRPSTSTGRSHDSTSLTRPSTRSPIQVRPTSGSTYFSTQQDGQPPSPSTRPFSGMFSSAMPMSDSPRPSPHPSRPPSPQDSLRKFTVLFLAASLFEFNIDRARREAGYPYLTYVPGEVFDVIGEKGELWLAKNQDDPLHQVGWIWCKHFARL
ncbi:MAG: hypothetical protein M1833_006490 [Piccolia ochrophora]|nr:MAG: hypothetical protein M1833_006490 [Piccolia ochrophora]